MSAPLLHAAKLQTSCCKYTIVKTIVLKESRLSTSIPDIRNFSKTAKYLSLSSTSKVKTLNLESQLFVNKPKVVILAKAHRGISTAKPRFVLGIETSCDDTGAAVVDFDGNVIGEALHSQTKTHVQMGGIIPIIARDLHEKNIKHVVDTAMKNSNVTFKELEAIAVTTEPGLALSLRVGLNFAQSIAKEYQKPLIPIHHMEAHALTVRMIEDVTFPFLVLLISGGHCLLVVAQDVNQFLLLGKGLDDSPGDAFDKLCSPTKCSIDLTARQLKLKNLKACSHLSGGAAIELIAKDGDPKAFVFPAVLSKYRDCNFSFAGLKYHTKNLILKEESRQGIFGGSVLPNAADICASFQEGILKHLTHRLSRGFLYTDIKGLLPENNKTLVVSGGVASNMFIRNGIEKVCKYFNAALLCPPPKLCTDNGLMVAWNGVEKLRRRMNVLENFHEVSIQPRSVLGKDIIQDVICTNIKVKRKLT